MKFIKYILFLLLITFIGLSVYIAVQPNAFTSTAQKTINAPANIIYASILDTVTTDRSAFWKVNEKLQTSSHIEPTSIQKTFTSNNIKNSKLSWNLKPNGDGTTLVTKTVEAKNMSFLFKAKTLFSGNILGNLGIQLTNDLKQLELDIIKSMTIYSIDINGIIEYGGGFYLYKTTSASASNISNLMAKQYAEILNFMQDQNISSSGMPFTIYNEVDANGNVIMSNSIPVKDKVLVADDSYVLCGYFEKTRAVKTTLTGNYTNLSEAWKTAHKFVRDRDLERSEQPPFEIYLNDPRSTPNPADYRTELYIPIKEEILTETE